MSIEEEYLQGIVEVLSDPFSVRVSLKTYERIEKIAKKEGRFYPKGSLHKALGLIYSRMERHTIEIEGKEIEGKCAIFTDGNEHTVLIGGMAVCLPLGLKSMAYGIKKGVRMEADLLKKIPEICSKSYIDSLAHISILKALVHTGQDRDGVCYNKIVDLIGDSNSTVKIKAINAVLKIGSGSDLINSTLSALKEDSRNIVPNPVWSPGMLALIGIHIYKTHDMGVCSTAIRIVEKYLTKATNEKVLNGILVILWGMTSSGYKKHLPFLVLMSLFSRVPDIRRSAIGLLIEYLGHNPSDRALEIIDSIKKRSPDILKVLLFGRVSRRLIIRYSNVLVSEGTPYLIKRAAQLKVYAGETDYKYDETDIFSKICAFRICLRHKNREKLEELVLCTDVSKLSPLVKIEMDLIRQVIKSVRVVGLSLENAQTALVYALRKNIFPIDTIRSILAHKEHAISTLPLRRTTKTPSTLLALTMLKDPVFQGIEKKGLECPSVFLHRHSSVYPSCMYLMGAIGTISKETAKHTLFDLLNCYDVDPVLGDIGSYIRMDALYLLVLPYTSDQIVHTLPGTIKKTLPMGIVASKLTRKRLHLTKEEKVKLVGYILKLAIDKSRRISLLLFSSILPSIKHLPYVLKYLLSAYTKYLAEGSVEDAIVAGCMATLKHMLQKRRKRVKKARMKGPVSTCSKYLSILEEQIKMMVCGTINTLISSDGGLSKKIQAQSTEIFMHRIAKKEASIHIQSIEEASSKNTRRMINEIKSSILI